MITVKFDSTEQSDLCVKSLNGQIIKGRRISASLWDGKTKYRMEETEEERQRRLAQWERFIGSEEDSEEEDDEVQHAREEQVEAKRRKVEKEDEDQDFEEDGEQEK